MRLPLLIRPATQNDVTAIADIWNPVIRDSVAPFTDTEKTTLDLQGMIRDKARLGYDFYLAVNQGDVLGFATYSPFRNGPGYARTVEHSIFLAPSAKRKGTGNALIERLGTMRGMRTYIP